LKKHTAHAQGDDIWLNADVFKAGDGPDRIICVMGASYQMIGLGGLKGNGWGPQVSDLSDHYRFGILSKQQS
jgi:hypothetical protein